MKDVKTVNYIEKLDELIEEIKSKGLKIYLELAAIHNKGFLKGQKEYYISIVEPTSSLIRNRYFLVDQDEFDNDENDSWKAHCLYWELYSCYTDFASHYRERLALGER